MFPAPRLISALAACLLLAAGGCDDTPPAADAAGAITLPSGLIAQPLDVITNAPGAKGDTVRFRYVAPDLQAGQDASADMQVLCDDNALPQLAKTDPKPQQIIIVLADRAVPFGEAAPDAVQYFEAYAIKTDACIWEIF
ncbi:MAG: DUF6497 family protein [Paracoccaceae bacterium]